MIREHVVSPVALRSWVDLEFSPGVGPAVASAVVRGLQSAHRRSASAHVQFDDDAGERYVYGIGMWRADHQELRRQLESLAGFTIERPKGAKRELLLVEGKVIYPVRVGETMPRRKNRIRIRNLSESRRNLLDRTSMRKYEPPLPGFELDETEDISGAEADFLSKKSSQNSLICVYYSSGPGGLGTGFWAPAALSDDHYLSFTSPVPLDLAGLLVDTAAVAGADAAPVAFDSGERPRTQPKLRTPSGTPAQN